MPTKITKPANIERALPTLGGKAMSLWSVLLVSASLIGAGKLVAAWVYRRRRDAAIAQACHRIRKLGRERDLWLAYQRAEFERECTFLSEPDSAPSLPSKSHE